MDTSKNLILAKGQDKTVDVKWCKYNPNTQRVEVTFLSGSTYFYSYSSIEWIKEPEVLNPALVRIKRGEIDFFDIQDIRVFHGQSMDYWRIQFSNAPACLYRKEELNVETSCLSESAASSCMDYLRQVAAMNSLKSDAGEVLLKKQYEKLDYVGRDTAMALYLNPANNVPEKYQKSDFIFPFGGNTSQFKAVQAALSNQISVIQGPPGTGKTQTILNIIANLLVANKTVQIVSNCDDATGNILEKLDSEQYNLGFLVAALGKKENIKNFIEKQTKAYPDLKAWEMDADAQRDIKEQIKNLVAEVSQTFINEERLALVQKERDSLLLEIQYFEQYCTESGVDCSMHYARRTLKSKKLMALWQECYGLSEKERSASFWFKIKSTLIYGISRWSFYQNDLPSIITLLQSLFYKARKNELNKEIEELKQYLNANVTKGKMDHLTSLSLAYLRAKLFGRYGNKTERETFKTEDIKKNAGAVLKEYPLILSTTFSSRSCLENITYDYLIMDEASQVDIPTGALALSGAKNAVIVGDLKQLPNVVKEYDKKRYDAVFNAYKLHKGYACSENSFLKSVCQIFPDIEQTLLREHYRCHPKIIDFCNQKFYNGELVVMTEDHHESDTLTLYRTNQGNHRRDHINQRQIDVTIKEALPMFEGDSPNEIGIVAPYKDQIKAITNQVNVAEIEIDTVHKFQGREKNTILLTTVDDVVTDFSDDPYLLNVAVSRAKKRLCLIASGNEQPADSNIGDLMDYIEYNNFEVVESEIYSIFDLLYQQYTGARIAFLKKHPQVSAYDSENLMYAAIMELLNERSRLSLNVICHQSLNMLIRNPKYLNDDECRYAMNTATHLDFLIYNRISKKPVIAIEVDGFHYHKPGTKQYERDRMKDHILELYGLPLLRFSTAGSGEIKQIAEALDTYASKR